MDRSSVIQTHRNNLNVRKFEYKKESKDKIKVQIQPKTHRRKPSAHKKQKETSPIKIEIQKYQLSDLKYTESDHQVDDVLSLASSQNNYKTALHEVQSNMEPTESVIQLQVDKSFHYTSCASELSETKIQEKIDTLSKMVSMNDICKSLTTDLHHIKKTLIENENNIEKSRQIESHLDQLIQRCQEKIIDQKSDGLKESKTENISRMITRDKSNELFISKVHSESKICLNKIIVDSPHVSEERHSSSKKSLNRTISKISFMNLISNDEIDSEQDKRGIQQIPVKLMYTDYMTGKNHNAIETSWLFKDSEGRLNPVDDSWQQIFQHTDDSENLFNTEEEFLQSKSPSVPLQYNSRKPLSSIQEDDEVKIEVEIEVKYQSKPPRSKRELKPPLLAARKEVLTKITEQLEEFTEPDILSHSFKRGFLMNPNPSGLSIRQDTENIENHDDSINFEPQMIKMTNNKDSYFK